MLNLITSDINYPVTLTEAKAQVRVDDTNSDTYLTALIQRATEQIEVETGVDLRLNTYCWSGHYNDLVDGILWLPRRPLVSVSWVKYYDGTTNTLDTWDSSNYYVIYQQRAKGYVCPHWIWPIGYLLRPDPLQVQFVAGYNNTAIPVVNAVSPPNNAKQAILLAVGTWYENRESETEARLTTLGLGYERILEQL